MFTRHNRTFLELARGLLGGTVLMRSGGNGKVEVVLAENRSAVWCWYLDTGQRRCLRLELRIRHHSNGDR